MQGRRNAHTRSAHRDRALALLLSRRFAFQRGGGVPSRSQLQPPQASRIRVDEVSLACINISTWRTDAGDLEVLTAIPTRDGGQSFDDDLAGQGTRVQVAGVLVRVASLADIIASKE